MKIFRKKYIWLITAILLPLFLVRAQDASDFALDMDALIEKYLQGLAGQLPANQQDQLETYRKYIKDSVNAVLPPGELERQLQAIEQAFPQSTETQPGGGASNPSGFVPPVTNTTSDQSLALEANPLSPAPKTPVTITANFNVGGGFAFPDVQKGATTRYTWYLDNAYVPEQSGVGQNTLTFTAGTLHTIHNVRLQARLSTGKIITAALLIPVVDVDIVWYTDTYTPPGYRGKALATFSSPVVAAAQAFVPPSFGLLNYVWTIDDDTPLNGFGIGKNRILVGFPQSAHSVSVKITDLGGNIEISKDIVVNRTAAEVLFHRVRTGKYDFETRAETAFEISPAGKFSVTAQPYFFGVQTRDGLRFRWTFDQNTLPEAPKNPDVFTLNIAQAQLKAGVKIQKIAELTVENKNPKKAESERFFVPITIR